jgi:hypothetical protein
MWTAELGRGRERTGKSGRDIEQQPPHLVSTLPTPRGVVQGSCWILKSGAARESHSTPTPTTPLIAFPMLNPILFYCDLRDFLCYFIKAPSHPPARQNLWAQNLWRCEQQDTLRVLYTVNRSGGSSVSIVSDYRLDDRGSIPGRGKGFSSSLFVQTSSEAHPASYPMGTGDIARTGRDADHSPA